MSICVPHQMGETKKVLSDLLQRRAWENGRDFSRMLGSAAQQWGARSIADSFVLDCLACATQSSILIRNYVFLKFNIQQWVRWEPVSSTVGLEIHPLGLQIRLSPFHSCLNFWEVEKGSTMDFRFLIGLYIRTEKAWVVRHDFNLESRFWLW